MKNRIALRVAQGTHGLKLITTSSDLLFTPMRLGFILCLFWCIVVLVSGASVALEKDEELEIPHASTTIYIEHALEPGHFTLRGTVTLGGVRGDAAKITQNSLTANELSHLNV